MATLVAYYSRSGENYWAGGIKSIEKGNTERVAEFIAEATGADLFQIDTVEPYSADYMTCIDEAKAELGTKARPAIKGYVDNMDDYDTIFIGYPNWWGTAPMCIFTFLEHYDLSGKRVVPFCTSEGSGLGSSVRDLKKACTGATVEQGLAIIGHEAAQAKGKAQAFAKKFA